jgi:hypothetical protein
MEGNMGALQNKPIFVVSSPRSGSTLFRLILDAHPRLAVPPPAWLYDFFQPFLYSYGDLTARENLAALAQDMIDTPTIQRWPMEFTAAGLADKSAEPSFPGLYDALHVLYAEAGGKERWGEKSPRNALWVDEIRADFTDAQFIHLIRDGRDSAIDLADSTLFPETLYAGANVWKTWVSSIRESAKRLPRDSYLEVKYEEFCGDPESHLKTVCEFLGEDFSPLMLQHHETEAARHWGGGDALHARTSRAISTDYCGLHKNLSEGDRSLLEHLVGDLLEELGYPLTTDRATPPERLLRQLLANDSITLLANAAFKPELRKRRQQRLKKGVWREEDRESQIWSLV